MAISAQTAAIAQGSHMDRCIDVTGATLRHHQPKSPRPALPLPFASAPRVLPRADSYRGARTTLHLTGDPVRITAG